ncbi:MULTISPECIES: response regulator transcription factor [unclassified Microbacterium]|uniref:response regulator n=1 Tax=unclassified Microbacterium TaxID=2609290 RepID=UPI001604EEC2|nr:MULTISPECIES: response regulator transcription factor [unclassified Microbacterium]QNA93215.1 response regulator transcription factor [Microbacterium sp. Se63.02b]QYM63423.1 response regulator transcription factor [Microbacterium sp. Se5.02b]
MTETIRVLLVDDQELIRVGFRMVLEAEADIVVVGEAGDGKAAIAQSRALAPDLVLMDIRMPELDGIAATEAIVREHPHTRVLVLTTFDLDEYAFGAIRAGASGFLLKDAQRHEMISAVRAVHRGDAALSPRITRMLLDHVTPQLDTSSASADTEESAALASLTERERDVFLAIGRGLTNAEIAQTLYVGESTVKTHVGRVLAKLGARDRIHAVILAHRLGLAG